MENLISDKTDNLIDLGFKYRNAGFSNLYEIAVTGSLNLVYKIEDRSVYFEFTGFGATIYVGLHWIKTTDQLSAIVSALINSKKAKDTGIVN